MKKVTSLAVASLMLTGALNISAITYDDNIVAIFGSGNPDTGWTSDIGPNGMELALRAKQRYPLTSTANVNGVYSEPTGLIPPNNNRARWNWEFSINSGNTPLSTAGYDYYVSIDTDTSTATSFVTWNALLNWSDNAYGDITTPNGANQTGLASAFPNATIAQQSQNLVFAPANGNPLLDATYNYELFAVAQGDGPNGVRVASVGIQVVVGAGGATVPDGGTSAVMFAGVCSVLGFMNRKR